MCQSARDTVSASANLIQAGSCSLLVTPPRVLLSCITDTQSFLSLATFNNPQPWYAEYPLMWPSSHVVT